MTSIEAHKGHENQDLIFGDSGISLNKRSAQNSNATLEELDNTQGSLNCEDGGRNEKRADWLKLDSYLHRHFALKNTIETLLDMVWLYRQRLVSDHVQDSLNEVICKQKDLKIVEERHNSNEKVKYASGKSGKKSNEISKTRRSINNLKKNQIVVGGWKPEDAESCSRMLLGSEPMYSINHPSKMLAFEVHKLIYENANLKTKLDAYRGLYKDSREKYLEYQNETERTLAILGRFVMASREIKSECENLKEVVHEMKLEKQLSWERLKEYRLSVEKLKKQLEDETERGNRLEEKAIELTQTLNKKIEDSIKNTFT